MEQGWEVRPGVWLSHESAAGKLLAFARELFYTPLLQFPNFPASSHFNLFTVSILWC